MKEIRNFQRRSDYAPEEGTWPRCPTTTNHVSSNRGRPRRSSQRQPPAAKSSHVGAVNEGEIQQIFFPWFDAQILPWSEAAPSDGLICVSPQLRIRGPSSWGTKQEEAYPTREKREDPDKFSTCFFPPLQNFPRRRRLVRRWAFLPIRGEKKKTTRMRGRNRRSRGTIAMKGISPSLITGQSDFWTISHVSPLNFAVTIYIIIFQT